MVWCDALWSTMKQFHIGSNLVNAIKQVFNEASSVVCINGQLAEWFNTQQTEARLPTLANLLQCLPQ